MSQARFSELAILHIESEVVRQLEEADLVKEFRKRYTLQNVITILL